jgi:hypothetical protein
MMAGTFPSLQEVPSNTDEHASSSVIAVEKKDREQLSMTPFHWRAQSKDSKDRCPSRLLATVYGHC